MAVRDIPLHILVFGWEIKDAVKFSVRGCEVGGDWFATSLTNCPCFSAAPSTVSIMHQVSRTVDSITLTWSQPDQPNGIILDYELQYYEKVPLMRPSFVLQAFADAYKHKFSFLSFLPR